MSYWRRKIGWYLMVFVNLWTLQTLYEVNSVRLITSFLFIALGGYWWNIEHGGREIKEGK